jgi:SAM-dependent methyltransferase
VFAEPQRWRAAIIEELRLRGAERCAAASPAYGFPQLFHSIERASQHAPPAGAWIDVGAGLGGVADFLQRTARRRVLAIEPSSASASAARDLFPLLAVAQAMGEALPIRDRTVAFAMANGVVSLLSDLAGLVREAARVLRPGGVLVFGDLWSTTETTRRLQPNTFWSLEDVIAGVRRVGFELLDVAICTSDTGWWPSAATQVDELIETRHHEHPEFDRWRRDRLHLAQVVHADLVLPATCSFVRIAPAATVSDGDGAGTGRASRFADTDGERPRTEEHE